MDSRNHHLFPPKGPNSAFTPAFRPIAGEFPALIGTHFSNSKKTKATITCDRRRRTSNPKKQGSPCPVFSCSHE